MNIENIPIINDTYYYKVVCFILKKILGAFMLLLEKIERKFAKIFKKK